MEDITFHFPSTVILKASAGSGKTHALTSRFVRLLLFNLSSLENILAVTFSNNSAIEMKKRIISLLKRLYFSDPETLKNIKEGFEYLGIDDDTISENAGRVLEYIFENYSDFQVRTIDSFMTAIYNSIATELGHHGDVDILFDINELMDYAYNLFLSELKPSTELEEFFDYIVRSMSSSRYIWNPAGEILKKIKKIYELIAKNISEIIIEDHSEKLRMLCEKILDTIKRSLNYIDEKKQKIAEEILNKKDIDSRDLLRLKSFLKTKKGFPPELQILNNEFMKYARNYMELKRAEHYRPFLITCRRFINILEMVIKKEGRISIDDINKKISYYINSISVPDIYFSLGERIYHFLIDEFQDTSPVQWNNLFPLIENSLSQGGSLFVVGDTKQAIYQFRRADYRIMKGIVESENPFPASRRIISELDTNYRSGENIVIFSKRFFKKIAEKDNEIFEAAKNSGLLEFRQGVVQKNMGKGYVEASVFEKDDERWKERIVDIVKDVHKRGFRYSDIAFLTHKNDDVNELAGFLNNAGIPVLPYSNLDIRERKVVKEIVSLLRFLDSPLDNLSFSEFITGEIMELNLRIKDRESYYGWRERIYDFLFRNRKKVLYKEFHDMFSDLWQIYFDELFRYTGYLPLYDLMSDIYRRFDLFEIFESEKAFLIKLLDVVNRFEMKGRNGLRLFFESYEKDDERVSTVWSIENPANINAVNLLTIHKAKGLEFPVVISVIKFQDKTSGNEFYLSEGPEGIRLYKIIKDDIDLSERLREIYKRKKIEEMTSILNAMYVAFTRAINELYVIGLKNKDKELFFDILSDESLINKDINTKFYIDYKDDINDGAFASIYFSKEKVKMPESEEKEINTEERLRGEIIHRILFNIEFLPQDRDCEEILNGAVKKALIHYRYPEESFYELLLYTKRFIMADPIREYFEKKEGRLIYREKEFCNFSGRTIRPDRIHIEGDSITVIDFKTGDRSREEEDVKQIREYMYILNEIYRPEKIYGVILYFDLIQSLRIEDGR